MAPIQRICRYPLLIKESLKHTLKNEDLHVALEKAYHKISEVVSIINDRKLSIDNMRKVIDVANSFESKELNNKDIIEPGRELLLEVDIDYFDGKKQIETHLFLFNDFILIAKKSKKDMFRYVVSSSLSSGTTVQHVVDSNRIELSGVDSKQKSIPFFCKNSKDKQSVLNVFSKLKGLKILTHTDKKNEKK